eukprot:gb/GECH01007629.1/.p1 GENE.gb/GECH01007629.1/~~gb/GECH01007629.1/.p1  ORF type:complete len:155 (+),score=24.35 gb/GECH01007629.1/:1-465(+)
MQLNIKYQQIEKKHSFFILMMILFFLLLLNLTHTTKADLTAHSAKCKVNSTCIRCNEKEQEKIPELADICDITGYRQELECTPKKETPYEKKEKFIQYQSCRPYIRYGANSTTNVLIFESIIGFIALLAGIAWYKRKSQLEQRQQQRYQQLVQS